MAPLDEDIHNRILAYVAEPKASVSCHAWKDHLYDSLYLSGRIRFMQKMHETVGLTFSYHAVRPLGEDFEESVVYNFNFSPNGTYEMQWTRTFDAWSSQSEQHFGRWTVSEDKILCETLEPDRTVGQNEVRFAPPGYAFRIEIDDILNAKGKFFQERTGAPPKPWEIPARTGKLDANQGIWHEGMWQTTEVQTDNNGYNATWRAPIRADARFVEIDGEMQEVSGDIVDNFPEQDWARLMKCRLRFGISG